MRRILGAIAIAVIFGGCSPNAAATEKCKDQIHGAGECANCCKRNGASGHEYVTGSTCKCLN